MYPGPFVYHKPSTLEDAIRLLETHDMDALLLAGGHSLVPIMKQRMAQPEHLIDLAGIEALRGIRREGDTLVIGAMTTHWQVESSTDVREAVPLLASLAGGIADAQVRNRGTIGGSLAYADPAADYPAALLVLDAVLEVAGPSGRREVAIADWTLGLMATALEDGEILTAIRIPIQPESARWAYLKVQHPASRFALVGVAALLDVDARGICRSGRIGVTGVAEVPFRATAVETALSEWQPGSALAAAIEDDLDREGVEVTALLDVAARRRLCATQIVRAIEQAFHGNAANPDLAEQGDRQ